jgi:hypothetical protein
MPVFFFFFFYFFLIFEFRISKFVCFFFFFFFFNIANKIKGIPKENKRTFFFFFFFFFRFFFFNLLTSAVSPRDLGLTSTWTEWKPERAARVRLRRFLRSCCQNLYGWRVEARPPVGSEPDFSGFVIDRWSIYLYKVLDS